MFRHVEPAVNLLVQGERQLTGTNTLETPLRIGASDTICRYFLVPYLQRFHKEFPQVTIKVTNATSIGCAELLEHHQIDFAFCNYPNSKLQLHTNYKTIFTFQDVFAANKKYFDFTEQKLSLFDLHEYPILMLDKKSTTSEFLHSLFLQKRHEDLYPLQIKEKLPQRHLVLAYHPQIPSAAAKEFLNYFS